MWTRTALLTSVVGLVVTIFGTRAFAARPIDIWDFGRLSKESDLIFIGTCVVTETVKKESTTDEASRSVDTMFQVLAAFKGKMKEGDKVRLRHYQFLSSREQIETEDGPGYMRFKPGSGYEYLIFVKRTNEGTLEPTAGQYDPAVSIRFIGINQPDSEKQAEAVQKNPTTNNSKTP